MSAALYDGIETIKAIIKLMPTIRRLILMRTLADLLAGICIQASMILIFSSVIYAGPPLRTADTGTPGDGKIELNVGVASERTSKDWRIEGPIFDFNYGYGDRIQLKYETSWVFVKRDGDDLINGAGNSLFGLKWRFLDQETLGFAMSVYPRMEFNNLSSSAQERPRGRREKFIASLSDRQKNGQDNNQC